MKDSFKEENYLFLDNCLPWAPGTTRIIDTEDVTTKILFSLGGIFRGPLVVGGKGIILYFSQIFPF